MSKLSKISSRWRGIIIWSTTLTFLTTFPCLLFREYKLIWLYFYSAISNSPLNWIVPVTPQEPILLLYGQIYEPFIVAIIAGIASFLFEIYNYQILVPACNISQLAKFRKNYLYRILENNFGKMPFIIIVFVGFTPFPHLPIRVLSVTSEYPIYRYAFASFIGRFPFYYILAKTGAMLNLPFWFYALLFLVTIILVLIAKITSLLKKRYSVKKYQLEKDQETVDL